MKLEFELVPEGCFKSNLRTVLSKAAWDFIRKDAYRRAGNRCAICGAPPPLDAHEKWDYSSLGVQKLVDVIAVCKACHAVIHINRTFLAGDERAASEHFMKVNGVSYAEYRKALGEANEKQKKWNEVGEWALDLTWLQRFIGE